MYLSLLCMVIRYHEYHPSFNKNQDVTYDNEELTLWFLKACPDGQVEPQVACHTPILSILILCFPGMAIAMVKQSIHVWVLKLMSCKVNLYLLGGGGAVIGELSLPPTTTFLQTNLNIKPSINKAANFFVMHKIYHFNPRKITNLRTTH